MVCHETYKDEKNNWLSPDEVLSKDGKIILNDNNERVKVGPSERRQNWVLLILKI